MQISERLVPLDALTLPDAPGPLGSTTVVFRCLAMGVPLGADCVVASATPSYSKWAQRAHNNSLCVLHSKRQISHLAVFGRAPNRCCSALWLDLHSFQYRCECESQRLGIRYMLTCPRVLKLVPGAKQEDIARFGVELSSLQGACLHYTPV